MHRKSLDISGWFAITLSLMQLLAFFVSRYAADHTLRAMTELTLIGFCASLAPLLGLALCGCLLLVSAFLLRGRLWAWWSMVVYISINIIYILTGMYDELALGHNGGVLVGGIASGLWLILLIVLLLYAPSDWIVAEKTEKQQPPEAKRIISWWGYLSDDERRKTWMRLKADDRTALLATMSPEERELYTSLDAPPADDPACANEVEDEVVAVDGEVVAEG